jgi:hypothetical protein
VIEYWKSKEVTSPAMVEYVSNYVLDHCGDMCTQCCHRWSTYSPTLKTVAGGKVPFFTHSRSL